MNVLCAIFTWRQLNVVLRRTLTFHLDDFVSSILACRSSGGRDSCESGSIRVESILIVFSSMSLLSSDGLLRIKSSVHEVDVVLIFWTSIHHVCLHSGISI
jgi:hypothetical protein